MTATLTYTPPGGAAFNLNDQSSTFLLEPGLKDSGMAPVVNQTTVRPQRDGDTYIRTLRTAIYKL